MHRKSFVGFVFALCVACHTSAARTGGPPAAGPIPSRHCDGNAPLDRKLAQVPSARASWFNTPHGNERLYVLEAGPPTSRAPTLVLIHGVGKVGSGDFYPVLAELSRSRHVLAVDLPGFGRSSPEDQDFGPERLIDAVSLVARTCAPGKLDVLGHSSGGALALLFAAEHAELVRRLVLVSVAGVLRPEVLLRGQLHKTLEPMQANVPILGKPTEKLGDAMIEFVQAMAPSSQAIADTGLLGKSPSVLAATALLDYNFGYAIARVRAPSLILWGEEDKVAPSRIAHLLDDRLPDSQLVFLPDAGHVVMHDQPARLSETVLSYLAGTLKTPEPRASASAAPSDGGCKNEDEVTLSGDYETIRIEKCRRFRLHRVRAKRVSIHDSEGRIDDSQIAEGLQVAHSELSITGGSVDGDVAVETSDSKLDLAGVAIAGTTSAIHVKDDSDVITSVTPIKSPQTDAILHRELTLHQGDSL